MQERRHAAIMFTDIVGYTALMGKDEDRAFELLRINRSIHEVLINKYNGTLIKEIGDGTLISFPLASDAVRCAINIQQDCKEQNIPLKIGIHEGEMVFVGPDVLGDGVNIASRLQESAPKGCINISGAVYRDIKNKTGIYARFVEEKLFKNVDEPIKVYTVCSEETKGKDDSVIPPSEETSNSIAVLPFVNMSNDPDQDYFCDGLSEEILNVLAQFENLKVAARTSSFSFRGKDVDITEIGQKLKVRTILEGSVRKSGNRLRITAQLINVSNGYHLWSERFDRQLEDIFEIQDQISHAILSALKIKLLGKKDKELIKPRAYSQEAYQLYLKGKYNRYKETPEGLLKAIDYYKNAINLEPEFSEAYSALAVIYALFLIYSLLSPDECIKPLNEAVQKALELDENNPEAFLTRALINYWYSWDFEKAELYFRKAIELNPNSAEAHVDFGNLLAMIGRREESLPHIEEALKLDPFNVTVNFYAGWAYFLNDDFDLMFSVGDRMLEVTPPWVGHVFMGFKNWMAKRFKDAINQFELSTQSQLPVTYTWLGCVLGISGEKEKAQNIINKLLETSKNQYVGAYNIGLICLGMGDSKKAYTYFKKGCDEQHDGILLYLNQKFKVLPGLKKDKLMEDIIKKLSPLTA